MGATLRDHVRRVVRVAREVRDAVRFALAHDLDADAGARPAAAAPYVPPVLTRVGRMPGASVRPDPAEARRWEIDAAVEAGATLDTPMVTADGAPVVCLLGVPPEHRARLVAVGFRPERPTAKCADYYWEGAPDPTKVPPPSAA